MHNPFDAIFAAFGNAMADIRHKVVEEGWFGKQVTDTHPTMESPATEPQGMGRDVKRASFDELWSPAEKLTDKTEAPEMPGQDFDR